MKGLEKFKTGEVEPSWAWAKNSSPVLLIVATLLFTIAFAAPYWARTDRDYVKRDEFFGVWRFCASSYGGGHSCDDFIDLGSYGDWLRAVQSFSTLSFFGLLGTTGIYCAYVFANMDSLIMLGCVLASSFLVGVFEVITVGVFAVEYPEYFMTKEESYTADTCKLAWAWYLALVATVLTFTAPLLISIEHIKNSDKDE